MKRIQLPDGSIGEFPADMPDEAIQQVLRKQYPPSATPAAPAEPTWAQRGQEFLQGAKGGFDEAALGIKGLLPQAVQDAGDRMDKALGARGLTKETATPIPDTWAGTTGAIGTNIALTAGPSLGIARGAALLPSAMARFGANVAGQGALNAAIAPENRGTAAALGAGGQVLGDAVAAGAPKLWRALKLTTRGGREALRESRAGQVLADALGDEAGSTAQVLRQGVARPNVTAGIDLNTLQTVRQAEGANAGSASAKLAGVQLGAAPYAPAENVEALRKYNAQVFDAMQNRAGAEGTDAAVAAAEAAREAATGGMRSRAYTYANREGATLANPVLAALREVRQNNVVGGKTKRVADFAERTLGAQPNAETLYALRKELTDMLEGPVAMDSDSLTAATKGAQRDVMRIVSSIDEALQSASSTSDIVNQMPLFPPMRNVAAPGRMTHTFGEGLQTDPGLLQVPSGPNQRNLFGAAGDTRIKAGDLKFHRLGARQRPIPGAGETVPPDQLPKFPREGQIDMFAEGVEQGTPRIPPRVINSRADRLPDFSGPQGQIPLIGEEASPGRWNPYLQRYSELSGPVNSARAQRNINEALQPAGGRIAGDNPEVTRTVLARAMNKFRTDPKFGTDKLSPAAAQRYDDLAQFLQRQEEPTTVLKAAATGGGGSMTTPQAVLGENIVRAGLAQTAASFLPGAGLIYSVSRSTQDALQSNMRAEVARMMLDPQRAAKGIEAALRRNAPLTPAQQIVRQQLINAGVIQPMQQGNQ